MTKAKDIIVKVISAKDANDLVKRVHYSGKVVPNSQLHFGVFLNDKLEGAMSFGPPMMKKNVISLVKYTRWNSFIELNRMAFSDVLPRNSESRAMAVAFRLIKKHYPHIEWILSFSDGTQCGDGTIYRAAGFMLTGIKENTGVISLTDGTITTRMAQTKGIAIRKNNGKATPPKSSKPLNGYQFRYIYFLNQDAINRLTVPILPFSRIDEMGAGMYKGEKRTMRDKQAMDTTSVTAAVQH